MKMADTIEARLIIGVTCDPMTEMAVRAIQKVSEQQATQISFHVFQVKVNGVTRYCCFAGGQRSGPPPEGGDFRQLTSDTAEGWPLLTLIGQAALEALANVPVPSDSLVFAEIRKGKTPIRTKMIEIFKRSGNAKVCFFGDLAGELDGLMSKSINLQGMIDVKELLN